MIYECVCDHFRCLRVQTCQLDGNLNGGFERFRVVLEAFGCFREVLVVFGRFRNKQLLLDEPCFIHERLPCLLVQIYVHLDGQNRECGKDWSKPPNHIGSAITSFHLECRGGLFKFQNDALGQTSCLLWQTASLSFLKAPQ